MFDVILSVLLAFTTPTTTTCDLFLDDQGRTFEICREEVGQVEWTRRAPVVTEARER